MTDKTFRFKHLSFLHWNVNGLLTKLKDRELIQYISSFHFVCLVETFVDYLETGVFSSHTVFCKPAVKLTKQGRKSGGVLCLIKNELVPYVKEIKCDRGHVLCFLLDKKLFGFNRDVVYMCAYVPPENSPYYSAFDIDDGISLLEESLADVMLSLDDVYLLLCGDLNSRIANEFPISQSENYVFARAVEEIPVRCSEDSVLNPYGKKLLNMCTACVGLNILNGVCNGDLQGRYTFISHCGNSVNDYFMAGFKKDYSTVDHMFTLMAMIQKQFALNRKLYVAFIDFEKAFDSISRKLLWPILLKNGIKGRLYKRVRSMYENVKARIRCGATFTDYINCTRGVKQGDVCSPVLFSLFINELALDIIYNGRHGVSLSNVFVQLVILLFADDMILLSETVIGLQTQLNNLFSAASRLQLKVNMNKSNIVVFRKGGYLGARERWVYGDCMMKVVNSYKYLGICFSTRLSFYHACQDLVSRAKRALLCIMSKLYRTDCNSINVFLKIFDAQVQPIVLYGAEIWGLESCSSLIDNVHLFGLKRYLGVDRRTPNDLVYGEVGRFPIQINAYVRCIRYWLKLIRMEEHRLPLRAYKMLLNLDQRGKTNWVTNIRKTLCANGFSYVWDNQGVGCLNAIIREFRQRLIDIRWQTWDDHVNTSDRFSLYRQFKTLTGLEPYLMLNLNRHIRYTLTRFRFGVSDIKVHRSRFKVYNVDDFKCPLCLSAVDSEVHFVLCCPAFDDLRYELIEPKYFNNPCEFRLALLLATQNERALKNLALFVYKAFCRRKTLLLCRT